MSERTKAQLLAENKRLRAEVERLDQIVNPPPPEPPEEPAPKPRHRDVPQAFLAAVWARGRRS
jgi:outer membrane protein TolC